MQVLGARLTREHDELLRADTLGVHVDDDLEAGLLELGKAEVRHLDVALLGRGEHDAGGGERRGCARLGMLDLGAGQHVGTERIGCAACSCRSGRGRRIGYRFGPAA